MAPVLTCFVFQLASSLNMLCISPYFVFLLELYFNLFLVSTCFVLPLAWYFGMLHLWPLDHISTISTLLVLFFSSLPSDIGCEIIYSVKDMAMMWSLKICVRNKCWNVNIVRSTVFNWTLPSAHRKLFLEIPPAIGQIGVDFAIPAVEHFHILKVQTKCIGPSSHGYQWRWIERR